MSSDAARLSDAPRPPLDLRVFVVGVVVMAMIGAVLVAGILDDAPSAQRSKRSQVFRMNEPVTTDFGVMSVDRVDMITPQVARALEDHGIRHRIAPGTHHLLVATTITNLQDRQLRYAPGQFRLHTNSDEAVVSPAGSGRHQIVEGKATTKVLFNFPVHRHTDGFVLEFQEAGGPSRFIRLEPRYHEGAHS